MPRPLNTGPKPDDVERLLALNPVIQNACALDLLGFLHRHPRTLLTSEQLAGFVGYPLKNIAKALDAFIDAGLLGRTAPASMHAARMFLLLIDDPQLRPVRRLLELADSREGRRAILEALNPPKARPEPGAAPELRLA